MYCTCWILLGALRIGRFDVAGPAALEHVYAFQDDKTGGFFSKRRDVDVPAFGGRHKVEKHASLIREFVHSVKMGSAPETICTDNIKSLAMTLGTVESAELGKRVKVVN